MNFMAKRLSLHCEANYVNLISEAHRQISETIKIVLTEGFKFALNMLSVVFVDSKE